MRCFEINTAGSAMINPPLADPLSLVGKEGVVVWDKDNQYDKRALSYRLSGFHIGFVKAKGSKQDVWIKSLLFEAVLLNMPTVFTIVEAVFKDSKPPEGKKAWNTEGRGKFTHFTLHVEVRSGCGATSYSQDDKEYLRLTRLLGKFSWEDRDGLDSWMINCHRTYKDYEQAMYGYITDGQINHHKAEMRIDEIPIPVWEGEGDGEPLVTPLPEHWAMLIDALDECIGKEVLMFDDDIGVAGTYDMLGVIGPFKVMGDWKRNHCEKRQYKRQVAGFYAHNTQADIVIIADSRQSVNLENFNTVLEGLAAGGLPNEELIEACGKGVCIVTDKEKMASYYNQVGLLAELENEVNQGK